MSPISEADRKNLTVDRRATTAAKRVKPLKGAYLLIAFMSLFAAGFAANNLHRDLFQKDGLIIGSSDIATLRWEPISSVGVFPTGDKDSPTLVFVRNSVEVGVMRPANDDSTVVPHDGFDCDDILRVVWKLYPNRTVPPDCDCEDRVRFIMKRPTRRCEGEMSL